MMKRNDILPALFALLAVACGSESPTGGSASGVFVQVSPTEKQVAPQESVAFAAAVTGAVSTAVEWSVSPGGGAIDTTGHYVAPQTIGVHYVYVRSVADPNATATATVTVVGPSTACETAPLRTTGTTYYYCDCAAGAGPGCVPGSDANSGTSPATPRRTLASAEARFNSMAAGDTVALCRTGAWTSGQISLTNTSCRPTSDSTWCDLRDYVPSWGSASSPRPRIDFGTADAIDMSTAGVQGVRVWNLDIRQTYANQAGIFLYNGVHDLDFCNLRLDGSNLGFYPGNSTGSGVAIHSSQFYNHRFAAIFGGCNGLRIEDNYFENNGLNGTAQDHTIYIGASVSNVQIRNNEIVIGPYCAGPVIVGHVQPSDLVIENNYIHGTATQNGCYGIMLSPSGSGGGFNRALVKRNRVSVPWRQIHVQCCQGCVISDNVAFGNVVQETSSGCNQANSANTYQNNTVYGGTVTVQNEGSGHVVENNAVWTTGTSCFSVGAATARNANNYCRASGGVGVGTIWRDAPNGDFRPTPGGPLDGAANQTYYSPIAIGTTAWSMTDRGQARAAPISIGAFQ